MSWVLLQIRPGDVRRMLLLDSASLGVGTLLLVAGVLTLVIWAIARRRAGSLLWLGAFALLYGLRTLARTATLRLCFDAPPGVWDHAASAMTYVLPIPLVRFAGAILPAWRRVANWITLGQVTFAALAIASDAALHRPDSARVPNNVIAIGFFLGLLGWLFRPGLSPSRELRTLRVGVLAASLTALADNLRGLGVVTYPGPDLEPFGFTVAVACLSLLAAWRDRWRRATPRRHRSRAEHRPADPGLDTAGGHAAGLRPDPGRALPADDGGGRRLLRLPGSRRQAGGRAGGGRVRPRSARGPDRVHGQGDAGRAAGTGRPPRGRARGDQRSALRKAGWTVRHRRLPLHRRPPYALFRGGPSPHAASGPSGSRGSGGREERARAGLPAGCGLRGTGAAGRSRGPALLYTDGLPEATNAAEELFGLERVKTALAVSSALPPDAAADALLGTMDAWSGQPARDDLTIVLVDKADGS